MQQNDYYKQVSTYYNEDAHDFDKRYRLNPVLQQIRQSFREEVKRFDSTTMLEIGCGTGIDIVHFSKTHPERQVFGIDISPEMVKITNDKLQQNGCENAIVKAGSVENIEELFPDTKFDLIYVFFGALNTVEDLAKAKKHLNDLLNPGGVLVLTFVNKFYLGGMFLEMLKLKPHRAMARIKPVWGGYSPVKYLPSRCYSVSQIKKIFRDFKLLKTKGYSIFHPAWYYIRINQKLGRIRRILWKVDAKVSETFFGRFGEYSLFVFRK